MTVDDIRTAPAVTDDFAAAWRAWHEEKDAALADPHGFLAVTGISWLTGDPQRVPGAPGSWSTGGRGPVVVLDPGEELLLDGTPVTGRHEFGVLPERGGVLAGYGNAVVEGARRGGNGLVRPRHPDNPRRLAFRGTPAFPPDPRWVVEGRYVPFDAPRPTNVGAAVEGLEHVYHSPGQVAFTLDGVPLRVTAFPGKTAGSLLVLFTDATSGVTTYGAVRSLRLDAPDAGGRVLPDFNRANHLACPFTEFPPCPVPPAENRPPVAVEAGERTP